MQFPCLLKTPALYSFDELKGECHGKYDGLEAEFYKNEPHFKEYKSLSLEDQIFFTCGEGVNKDGKEAESKADVARRAVPKIKEIASRHINEQVIIVSHRGLFSLFNLRLAKYRDEHHLPVVEHGTAMHIEATANTLYLISDN